MSRRREHAVQLYLHGIRDGHPREAVERHTGARYTQHSTGVPDGKEGFVAFFDEFLRRHPVRDIQVIRAIEEPPYIFLHVHQVLNDGAAAWVTADLFDTDDDERIIEHWDVIEASVGPNPSGHSQMDGATEIGDREHTERNKATVAAFLATLQGGQFQRMAEFVAPSLIQHAPEIADGLEAFRAELSRPEARTAYHAPFKLIGEGNFVVSFGQVDVAGVGQAQFDIFRLDRGRIVERWCTREPIPPADSLVNSGKF